jgi:hypothetical protein
MPGQTPPLSCQPPPEPVGRDGEARTLGDVVDVADNFQPASLAENALQQCLQTLPRAFDAGRHETRSNDSGFEETEVIFREVEDLGEIGNVGRGTEIDTGQAQHGLFDDSQISLDWRTRRSISAMHTEVDRDIQHPRALGKIHAQEKNVAPTAVRQVHPHRSPFAENRISAVRRAFQEFAPETQWLIDGMPHAKHPLIATHRAHAAPYLISQRLEGEPVIRLSQGTGDGVARSFALLNGEKFIDGFLEPPLQQVFVAVEGNQPPLV